MLSRTRTQLSAFGERYRRLVQLSRAVVNLTGRSNGATEEQRERWDRAAERLDAILTEAVQASEAVLAAAEAEVSDDILF
jgi:hypothetical protein